jgi:signal transduction histidine kinase
MSFHTHAARRVRLDQRNNVVPRLRGRRLLLARAAWVIAALISIGLFAAYLSFAFAARQHVCAGSACPGAYLTPQDAQAIQELGFTTSAYASYVLALDITFALGYIAVGALIFWRKSDERMALFAALALVLFGATWPIDPDLLAGAPVALQVVARLWKQLSFSAFFLLIYLFPDGRFVPGWTRWAALIGVVGQMATVLLPGSPIDPATWPVLLGGTVAVSLLGITVFSQIYRYIRVSDRLQRQQTKWVAFGVSLQIVGGALYLLLIAQLPALDQPGLVHFIVFDLVLRMIFGTVALLIIPLAIGMAILRYRLWEIDILINRTLVYGALTGAISSIYVLIVGALGTLFQTRGNLLIALAGAGVVAVIFQPLRERLQRGINRLLYGERDDPYAVLSRMGRQLETTLAPTAVLPTIVATVQDALKLPYVAIALKQDDTFAIAATAGEPVDAALTLPLIYQNETVGQLILAPRAGEATVSPVDRKLLDDLARQAGVAAHAVRLTSDLQHSRERLVTAREEERRRLRRDLHDGLGPQLATQTLKLEAARDLIASHPTRAADLLSGLIVESQTALADIRRLVYALRPPALDELGLVGALREQAAQYQHSGDRGAATLRIVVDAPERLPPLPAAVEVAAYRIALEALTNVAKHAAAHNCTISLGVGNGLHLDIRDDGRGLPPDRRAGVGLTSMRERAAELGGQCSIGPVPGGGTAVVAWLPLP